MEDESGSNPPLEPGQTSSSPSPASSRARPRPLNLLLAEDNLPDALLVREAIKMEDLPVEVYIAPDGSGRLSLSPPAEETRRTVPHLVLLDLNLPKVAARSASGKSGPARSAGMFRFWWSRRRISHRPQRSGSTGRRLFSETSYVRRVREDWSVLREFIQANGLL